MDSAVQIDNLQDFITRVSVIPTVTDVKINYEMDTVKLTAFDKHNRFLVFWEERADSSKLEEIKSVLTNNKINFSDGDWSREDVSKIK